MYITYGKNDFTKISKNLARYRFDINLVGSHQNNYIGISNVMNNAAKSYDILQTV